MLRFMDSPVTVVKGAAIGEGIRSSVAAGSGLRRRGRHYDELLIVYITGRELADSSPKPAVVNLICFVIFNGKLCYSLLQNLTYGHKPSSCTWLTCLKTARITSGDTVTRSMQMISTRVIVESHCVRKGLDSKEHKSFIANKRVCSNSKEPRGAERFTCSHSDSLRNWIDQILYSSLEGITVGQKQLSLMNHVQSEKVLSQQCK
ncbi:hypothetical protein CLF_112981 [Clonorchis sinensis]|uniref:Uncharacterized protein n=1 Tax=Clonorchis sinensis TaxID=79923 RepID=G7YXE3_CLOSI|nr:hypothetical protein CLF_112981 [Clonorchis sinensis]